MLDPKVYILESNQWKEQTAAYYPLTQLTTLDESLDRGNVTIKGIERRTPYPAFTKCKVVCKDVADNTVTHTDTQYYYLHDKVDQTRLIKPYLYDHTLMMIEPTKLLERYIIAGMSVTQPLGDTATEMHYVCQHCGTDFGKLSGPPNNGVCTMCGIGPVTLQSVTVPQYGKSVADVIDTLLATTPFRKVGDPQLFILDESLRVKLGRIKSCEFKWSCKMTLFECLHDVGKFIGAMPRLIPSAGDDRVFNTVSFDFFGKIGKNIDTLQYSAFSLDQQESNYCSELETYAENLIAQSDESQSTVTYPSKNGWITPRTTQDIKITEDNCEIVLPEKIYKISKVLIKSVKVRRLDGKDDTFENFDITNYVIEEQAWNLLSGDLFDGILACPVKANTLTYKENGNAINMVKRRVGLELVEIASIHYLIGAVANNLTNSGTYTYDAKLNDPRKLQFQVEYIPLMSMKIKAIKSVEQPEHSTLAYNQLAQINDSTSLGRNMWGSCQALGTPDMQIGIYFDKIADIPQIGDIFEDYIVTTVERTFKAITCGVALLTLSKDFNRLNEHISVNKAFRQWAIPADSIEKDLHYQEYCSIDISPKRNESCVYGGFVSRFGNVFETNVFNGISELDCATLQGENPDAYAKRVLLSCQSRAIANSLMFNIKTKDNYSAGLRKNGNEIIDVPYALETGEIDTAKIVFGDKLTGLVDSDVLPECPYYVNPCISLDAVVKKDAGEQLNMTYQLFIISSISDIVIGSMLTEKNPLVREFDKPKTFRLWRLNAPIGKFSQVITAEDGSVNTSMSMSVSYYGQGDAVELNLSGIDTSAAGWAITDENGYLYLARNSAANAKQTLYFNFKESRG